MTLFIDACAKKASRTRMLAESYLSGVEGDIKKLSLYETEIPLLDEKAIFEREGAALTRDKENPFVSLAIQFSNAERIIIAAPYWDLGYPAILRSYIEAIMVKGITFEYDENGIPQGLCECKELVYITTAGGHIQTPNHGFEHIKDLATFMLGIPKTTCYYVEGLDIEGADVETKLREKMDELKFYSTVNLSLRDTTPSIMIVDDSKINIIKTEHILKEAGYDTVSATSGDECLHILKHKKIDMILLDIEMPEMDGFQTLDEIRKMRMYTDIPVVFVTSDNTLDVVVKASQHKVSGFVTKPFSKEELMVHIKKAMFERK